MAPVGMIPVPVFVLAARPLVCVGVLMGARVEVLVDVAVLVGMGVAVLVGMDEITVAVLVGVPVGVLVSVAMLVRMGVRLGMGVAVGGVDRLVVHGILPVRRTAPLALAAARPPPARSVRLAIPDEARRRRRDTPEHLHRASAGPITERATASPASTVILT